MEQSKIVQQKTRDHLLDKDYLLDKLSHVRVNTVEYELLKNRGRIGGDGRSSEEYVQDDGSDAEMNEETGEMRQNVGQANGEM